SCERSRMKSRLLRADREHTASANPPVVAASVSGAEFPMPSASRPPVRHVLVAVFALGALLATVVPASAQGFGLGARFAWVKQDTNVDADSVRFFGLHMRAIGGRSGFE